MVASPRCGRGPALSSFTSVRLAATLLSRLTGASSHRRQPMQPTPWTKGDLHVQHEPTAATLEDQFAGLLVQVQSGEQNPTSRRICSAGFSPHLSTPHDDRVGRWTAANGVGIAYTPFYCSWLDRIQPQFA